MSSQENDNKLVEKLKQEAEEYYTMAKNHRDNRWRMTDQEVYIIDRKWVRAWKKYTNYEYIKRKMRYYSPYSSSYSRFTYDLSENPHPGPIDNSRLLVPLAEFINDGNQEDPENQVIKTEISEREDIRIFFKPLWEFFQSRYGGGPEIIRKHLEDEASYSYKKTIEIYSRMVQVILLPIRKTFNQELIESLRPRSLYISRTKTLLEVKKKFIDTITSPHVNYTLPFTLGQNSSFTPLNLRLWKIQANSTLDEFKKFLTENLNDIVTSNSELNPETVLEYLEYIPLLPLKNLEFSDTDICVLEYVDNEYSPNIFEVKKIEMKEGECEWCHWKKILRFYCSCKEVWYCTSLCQDKDYYYHSRLCKRAVVVQEDALKPSSFSKHGLVGLQNLGNTCFMNTSLQCMSNCRELTEYFLKDYFKEHINSDNPIGTQGLLARSYSNLLKNLWYGRDCVYSPYNFKSAIEAFQSMFIGYQQHDTQEFLNYLLDGLHEDLNKVKSKPFVQKDESDKEDGIKSQEQWNAFLRRNQSLLVDLLYGQYKSTLYCPDPQCGKISTTFDPFLTLSLPLTSKFDKYEAKCFFIFYNAVISPIQLEIPFTEDVPVICLRNKMSKILSVHPFSFILARMTDTGDLDYLVNSAMMIKSTESWERKIVFFCFQINPEIFNNPLNNKAIEPQYQVTDYTCTLENMNKNKDEIKTYYSEEYTEDETGKTREGETYYSKYEVKNDEEVTTGYKKFNTDENHGLTSNFIRVVLYLRKYEESYPAMRQKLVFPRLIYINKQWSTKKLHLIILNYFSEILKSFHNLPDSENLWDTFFADYEATIKNATHMKFEQQRACGFPYVLRLKEIFESDDSGCVYCKDNFCGGCLLPCTDDITIQDLINKIPRNSGMEIDNTYEYLNDDQRKLIGMPAREFSIDATWLSQYMKEIKNLNSKHDFDVYLSSYRGEATLSIYSCFKNFVKIEKLLPGNEWFCPNCKTHQLAQKKMEIYKAPHILIIHLKRFRNEGTSKIENIVDFPIQGLDISNIVIQKTEDNNNHVYDLFAIANHYGGLFGGHYVSYAKNHMDDKWYCFNDSSVSSLSEDLVSSSAYVLFYRRRNLDQLVNMEELYKKPFIDLEKSCNGKSSCCETTESDSKMMTDS